LIEKSFTVRCKHCGDGIRIVVQMMGVEENEWKPEECPSGY